MNKEDLWLVYCKKNPSFEGEGNITMTKNGLKKLFDETYNQAHQEGNKSSNSKPTSPDFFSDLLKNYRK
jgi:hypothetical protein